MDPKELRLYLGIIVPNFLSLFVLICLVLWDSTYWLRSPETMGWAMAIVFAFDAFMSIVFWYKLPMSFLDYLKFFSLNFLVILFWMNLLIF